MKRTHVIIIAFVAILMSAFYVTKVNAEEYIISDNLDGCLQHATGDIGSCPGNTPANIDFRQTINLPLSEFNPEYKIDDISLYMTTPGNFTAGAYHLWVRIEDENHVNLFQSSSTTSPWVTGWNTIPFDETYIYNSSTTTPKFLYFRIQCDSGCGGSTAPSFGMSDNYYGLPFVGTFNSTTPGYLGDQYPMLYNYTYSTSTAQLMFKIGSDDPFSGLSITYPDNQSTQSGEFDVGGTCVENLDFYLWQGVGDYNLRTQGYTFPIDCNNYTWGTTINNIDGGYWWIEVRDSTDVKGLIVYFIAQTPIPPYTTTTNPFINSSSTSEFMFLWGFASSTTKYLRPFSYVWDIYNAISTAFSNASATPMFQEINVVTTTTLPTGGFTFDIPEINNTQIEKVLPSASWSTIKAFSTVILYLLFILYVYHRIKRIV